MSQNAVRWFDFTIHSYDDKDIPDIIEHLKNLCEKWVFQEEKAPTTGKLHLQGRMKVNGKMRLDTCIKRFRGWHISVTCKMNQNNFDYVVKSDTHIRGPWRWDEEVIFMPKNVRAMKDNLLPWQKSILQDKLTHDDRTINMIIDTVGKRGKSVFANYIAITKQGEFVMLIDSAKDILRQVYNLPEQSLYIFDLPRSIEKNKIRYFFTAIEEVKTGRCYDDRYAFKRRIFESPALWVFTNEFPEDLNVLSIDRWKFWAIENNELVPYSYFHSTELSDIDYDHLTELPDEIDNINADDLSLSSWDDAWLNE